MGAGDASRSDAERSQSGPPIGSGCGPTRIVRAAETQSLGVLSSRLW
jgi:hypothetical protein